MCSKQVRVHLSAELGRVHPLVSADGQSTEDSPYTDAITGFYVLLFRFVLGFFFFFFGLFVLFLGGGGGVGALLMSCLQMCFVF